MVPEHSGPAEQELIVWQERKFGTHDKTNLSLLSHFGFFGLYFMILLNRTWATGAIPLRTVN